MKKYISLFLVLSIIFFFSACSSGNEEILKRLDSLDSKVDAISDKLNLIGCNDETLEETAESTQETIQPTPTQKEKTTSASASIAPLSYDTIKDILGKADVMAGLDDKFSGGEIWKNSKEFFILLTYDCTFTEEVKDIINQNLQRSYGGADLNNSGMEFCGDDDLIHFEENEDTICIGFELSSMETALKIYQMDEDYFSSYDDFDITQDIMDEYDLGEPTHYFNFEPDGSASVSLKWNTSQEKVEQLYRYYMSELTGQDGDTEDEDEESYYMEVKGYAEDGTKLIFAGLLLDENSEGTISRTVTDS